MFNSLRKYPFSDRDYFQEQIPTIISGWGVEAEGDVKHYFYFRYPKNPVIKDILRVWEDSLSVSNNLQRIRWLAGITDSMDKNLGKLQRW